MLSKTTFFIVIALFLSFLTNVSAQRQDPSPPIQGDVFSTKGKSDCNCDREQARRSLNRWYQNEQDTINEWKGFAKDSFEENIGRARTAQARQNAQTIYRQNLTDIEIYSKKVEELYQCTLKWVEQCCKGRYECDNRNKNDEINTSGDNRPSKPQPEKSPKPLPTPRSPSQNPTSNQKPNNKPPNSCGAPQISGATTASTERIINLQEIAEIVFERYNTGKPIGIIKIKSSNRPHYLIALAGTEYFSNNNDTRSLLQDARDEISGKSSDYREAVFRAIDDAIRNGTIEPNSKIILAGHSLGGIIAQRMAVDNRLKNRQLEIAEVITFGSPRVGARSSATRYVFVEHKHDEVLLLLGQKPTFGTVLTDSNSKLIEINDNPTTNKSYPFHNNYPQSQVLAGYDVLGQKNSNYFYDIEPSTFLRYSAPRKPGTAVTDSERIGEEMMNKTATEDLGYWVRLSPDEASNYRQGFDAIYWDPKTNTIVIGEAKGGYNGQSKYQILGEGYGFKQGTIEWVRAAAQRIVRSRMTSDKESDKKKDKEVKWAEIILCILGVNHNLIDPNDPKGKRKLKETEIGLLRLPVCNQVRACQVKVRVELFHTEIKNGKASKVHPPYILDQYPR